MFSWVLGTANLFLHSSPDFCNVLRTQPITLRSYCRSACCRLHTLHMLLYIHAMKNTASSGHTCNNEVTGVGIHTSIVPLKFLCSSVPCGSVCDAGATRARWELSAVRAIMRDTPVVSSYCRTACSTTSAYMRTISRARKHTTSKYLILGLTIEESGCLKHFLWKRKRLVDV